MALGKAPSAAVSDVVALTVIAVEVALVMGRPQVVTEVDTLAATVVVASEETQVLVAEEEGGSQHSTG